MSFANPTKIHLGMAATFFGRTYRVIGRSVLGVLEGGGTYYWNEFNLETPGGSYATLVFEESGTGGKWRFFHMFAPKVPMTAKEAEDKCLGNEVNLDGTTVRVTRVDRSRVYAVEGKVPEGVIVGQFAKYFNAEAGDKMVVVSWTGDEVEFYSGRTITSGVVASAFNLSGLARVGFALTGGRSFLNAHVLFLLLFLGIICFGFIGVCCALRSPAHPPAVVVFQVAPSPLAVGATGVLGGRRYRIASHTLVEIAEIGLRFSRHEYELRDDHGNHFLLISGMGSNAANWILCAPINLPPSLTAQEVGGLSVGQTVKLDGDSTRIAKLFRSTIREVDENSMELYKPGDVLYGFSGAMKSNTLIVRWNTTNIIWLKGTLLADQNVKAAFAEPGGKW